MACRTPVIAARAGAAPELLAEGGGVLLDSLNASAMADAMERLLTLQAPDWRRLADQARAVAVVHNWDASVRLFEAALEIACQRKPR
jgi:glycosyltransferase involved in cell wall biosynthesis